MKRIPGLLLFALLFAIPLPAQPRSPSEFLGYELGSRFTPNHRIVDYFHHLAAESGRITVEQYGETWEGRPLVLAVITSRANQDRIVEIRARHHEILDPRVTSKARIANAVKGEPVVVWLAFGVHGNESSSSEAAMRVAWWAVSEADESMLSNTILLIDPVENPDGRERYVNWFRQKRGIMANPNPDAVEHQEPWPGGRYNHYLFDMNRDWAWATQTETRARIDVYRDWEPQVVVDLHEMYYDESYFFPPATSPVNANIAPDTTEWLDRFGRQNARAFSEEGWPFFVGEEFDLFYPGYGDSWPSLRGSIGMTYEVGGHGAAGTVVKTEYERLVTLESRIRKHTTAAVATVRTASEGAEELLRHTWSSHARLDDDQTVFVVAPTSPFFSDLIDLLDIQGIEYGFLADSKKVRAQTLDTARVVSRDLPAGALVIPVAQPQGALVMTLFERSPEVTKDFLEAQREKVDYDESTEFYDITGWSLPLAFNLDAWRVTASLPISAGATLARSGGAPEARYGWVLDGADPHVYQVAGRLLDHDVRFGVLSEKSRVGDREFERGSLVVLRDGNAPEVGKLLDGIASRNEASFIGFDTGWTAGLSLGSNKIHQVRDPKIALVTGRGVFPSSFGSIWWGLDAEYGIPHTVLDLDSLAGTNLDAYRVIVLPDGYGYAGALTESLVEKLGTWVRGGGTLVAIGGASTALRDEKTGVSSLRPRNGDDEDESDDGSNEPKRYVPIEIPGAVFRTQMNARSHYTMGIEHSPYVLVSGSVSIEPDPHGAANIVTIAEEDSVVAGVVWDESKETVRGAAWMVAERVGRGRVVTFAAEPYFRGFWKGTLPLFMNTVLYTPSFL